MVSGQEDFFWGRHNRQEAPVDGKRGWEQGYKQESPRQGHLVDYPRPTGVFDVEVGRHGGLGELQHRPRQVLEGGRVKGRPARGGGCVLHEAH